jgi:hypothetical protein
LMHESAMQIEQSHPYLSETFGVGTHDHHFVIANDLAQHLYFYPKLHRGR